MKIRSATLKDIPAIANIYSRSVMEEHASFELSAPDETEMRARMNAILDAQYPYLVAEDDNGHVVGYAYVSSYRPRPAYKSTVENTVYVAKTHWGQSIAKGLMKALINECRTRGHSQMIGVIACEPAHDASEIPSAVLHESLGFEQVGRLKKVGNKHQKWLDVLLMQKEL